MRALLTLSLLTVTAFAGCVDSDGMDNGGVDGMVNLRDTVLELNLLAGDALWVDHQDEPHPIYGWPTLSNPAPDAISWHSPIEGHAMAGVTTGLSLISPTSGITQGAGIALYGSLAVVPGFGAPTSVVDISDPAHPRVLSQFWPQESENANGDLVTNTHRGATIIAYPDGRIVTAISTSRIIDVWDITDPSEPLPLPYLEPTQGSHKVGVVPGTPIIYNAASCGGASEPIAEQNDATPVNEEATTCLFSPDSHAAQGTAVTEIFDLSDPEVPVHVQDFENGYSCHHIYFWNNAEQDRFRAICAGIEVTQIIDIADPRDPQVIVNVPVHHGIAGSPSGSIPIVAFSHFGGFNQDGTVLLVGDEEGGGGLPPGCVASVQAPSGLTVAGERLENPAGDGALSIPVGALWFYDISDETDPILQGWYSATRDPRTMEADASSCTAHHGRLIPEEGRDLIAMSFYGAGVHIIDFTDPTTPYAVDTHASGSDTWETWYYDGYLFTGDLARGMEVFTVDTADA